MKPLTLHLPDDVYDRAARRATADGTTLSGEAVELIKRYSEGNHHGEAPGPGDSRGAAADEVKRELAAIAAECGQPNWDGQGAACVSSATLRNAIRFVEAVPPGFPLPSPGVEADGHLTVEWYRQPDWTLSISVSPEGDLYYAALYGTNDVRGHEVFSGEIPEIIVSLIRRVYSA